MCRLAQLSRASFYRHGEEIATDQEETELRDAIQREYVARRPNGYRPITRVLKREGWIVNGKRVRRLMREDNLLGLGRRKFVVTTDSDHDFLIYPNLAQNLVLGDINQLWVADLTYVRLLGEFVYLAVVLDAWSRRVLGWSVERHMRTSLAVAALEQAIALRQPQPGLVHHSDRGSQYASGDYTDLLKAHGCEISMSRKSSPWENAGCESWMKTLKYEEVYRQEYRDLAEAQASLACFIEKVYNQKRLHSALGYLPPVEFEQALSHPAATGAGS
jgi:transposase InsO family protein